MMHKDCHDKQSRHNRDIKLLSLQVFVCVCEILDRHSGGIKSYFAGYIIIYHQSAVTIDQRC